MIRTVYGKPGEGMTYAEAGQLSTPSARPGLRLLCLLVQTRNGETRSLPVHTLRPMPPRVCAADSHATNGLRRWNLEASALGLEGGTGLYLREAHATRPSCEVVERYLRLGQANALRTDSRTVRAGGVGRKRMQVRIAAPNWHEIGRELTVGGELYGHVTYRRDVPLFIPLGGGEPTKHRSLVELRRYVAERYQAERVAEQVQGRAPGSSDRASPIRRTEARAERTLDPARTETASARECGSAFPSRAPEPSAARVG